jgi:TIR domain/Protein of unknown function (DUF3298)
VLFLSYASEDAARVEAFYDGFKATGLDPWMDRRDIPPGAVWEDAVFDAIARCDQFIFFLSRNSATKRGFLQREMKRAQLHLEEKLEDDLYVIPVRLDPVEMPRWLSRFQRFDAFDKGRISALIDFLLNKRGQGPAPTSSLRRTLDYRMKAIESAKPETCELEVAVPAFFSSDGKALANVNALLEGIVRGILTKFLEGLPEISAEELNEFPHLAASKDGLWIEPTVTTATSSLVSVEFFVSTYGRGAAHRQHFTSTVLVDIAKGAELQLQNILKDKNSAVEFFSRYCKIALRSQWELDHLAYYGVKEEFNPADAEGWLNTFDKPDLGNFQQFVFRDNNLVFFFDPYHVGPYAFGRRTVELQFNEIYKLLSDQMIELLIGHALK